MKTQYFLFNELEHWSIIVSFKKRTYNILISQKCMDCLQLGLKGKIVFEVDYTIKN